MYRAVQEHEINGERVGRSDKVEVSPWAIGPILRICEIIRDRRLQIQMPKPMI